MLNGEYSFAYFRAAEHWTDRTSMFSGENSFCRHGMMCADRVLVISDLPRKPLVILKSVKSVLIKGNCPKNITFVTETTPSVADPVFGSFQHVEHILVPNGALKDVKTSNPDLRSQLDVLLELQKNSKLLFPQKKWYVSLKSEEYRIEGGTIIPSRLLVSDSAEVYRITLKMKPGQSIGPLIATAFDFASVKTMHRSASSLRVILTAPPTVDLINELKQRCGLANVYTDVPVAGISEDGLSDEASSNGRQQEPRYALTHVSGAIMQPGLIKAVADYFKLQPSASKASNPCWFLFNKTKDTPPLPPTLRIQSQWVLTLLLPRTDGEHNLPNRK